MQISAGTRRLLVAAAVFLGLYLVEYPPMFVLGYWSWDGWVHKTITGVLLAVNLLAGQFAAKRAGDITGLRRRGGPRAG